MVVQQKSVYKKFNFLLVGPTPAAPGGPTGQGPVPGAPNAASTSWAAAAGKGLPPSEPNQTNGATNKQIEQLNSVREALFSPVSHCS